MVISLGLMMLTGIVVLLAVAGLVRLRRGPAGPDPRPSAGDPAGPETPPAPEDHPAEAATREPQHAPADSRDALPVPASAVPPALRSVHVPLGLGDALRASVAGMRGESSVVWLLGIPPLAVNLAFPDWAWFGVIVLLTRWLWLAGGASATLSAFRSEGASLDRLLDGIRQFHRVLGACAVVAWPAVAGGLLAYAGSMALFLMEPILDFSFPFVAQVYTLLLYACMAAPFVAILYVLPRLCVASCVAVDSTADARQVARNTDALLKGNMGRALMLFGALALVSALAWRLSPVALLFTEPLLATVSAAVYEQLRVGRVRQEAGGLVGDVELSPPGAG